MNASHTIHVIAAGLMGLALPMSREEACALTSIVGDCRVSQVVDIRKGVHCMIPKAIFVNYKSARGAAGKSAAPAH